MAVSSGPHLSLLLNFAHMRTTYVKNAHAKSKIVAVVRPGAVLPVPTGLVDKRSLMAQTSH